MNIMDFSFPICEKFLDFQENNLQFGILDLEITGKLFDNEIGVHPELYLGRSEFDSATDSVERSLVLCLIIGRDSEIFMPPLKRFSFSVRDKNPDSRRTRIIARSAVGIDD